VANNEEFGKTSPEQLKQWTRVLADTSDLPRRQNEMLSQVLDGEVEIGKSRIAYLNEYFDVYSEKLEVVKKNQKQLLDDTFSILNQKLAHSYQQLSSDIARLEDQLKGVQQEVYYRPSGKGKKASKKQKNSGDVSQIDTKAIAHDLAVELLNALRGGATGGLGHNNGGKGTGGSRGAGGGSTSKQTSTTNGTDAKTYTDASGLGRAENTIVDLRQQKENALAAQQASINDRILDIKLATSEEDEDVKLRAKELRLGQLDKTTQAESTAAIERSKLFDMASLVGTESSASAQEFGELRAREVNAEADTASMQELAKKQADYIAREELKARLANNGVLKKEDAARIRANAAKELLEGKKTAESITMHRLKLEEKAQRDKDKADKKQRLDAGEQKLKTLTGKGVTLRDRVDAFKDLTTNEETGKFSVKNLAGVLTNAISDLAKQLEKTVDDIAKYQGKIDTRLQGSNNETAWGLGGRSYWNQLTKDMMSVGAITPFFRQEDFAKNIETLVDKGIAFDLKQRAFLMTIQEKIATTFNVADGTLLRLIRIQQEDTTAGRLGMESALNSFLNEMYENTEYLKGVAESVRGSLQEMEALMGGAAATEVEYQVQKWMGSLYSVGMSDTAVNAISNALGQIASGQIEALTNGGAGNLLVMAANNSGKSIADILQTGLDAEETNKLLQATVNYLAEIAESSKDSRVVQQQLANVFGVKASDLRAATNLKIGKDLAGATVDSTEDIFKTSLSYDNMLNQLFTMAGSMASRTSIGEMMTNVWANGQYTLSSSMSNNPLSYILYKAATLLDNTVGGIPLPFLNVMGFGVDLETTVADLMRVASLSSGIFGSIGSIVQGLGSSFSGKSMLERMGISEGEGIMINHRGRSISNGIGAPEGGGNKTTSESGYVGNSSPSDIKDSTIQESEDSKKQQMIEAKEEAESNQVDVLNTYVLKIYELLDNVASGKQSFNVKVSSYGLVHTSGGAQGGVSGLLNNSAAGGNAAGTSSGLTGSAGSSNGGMLDIDNGFGATSGGGIDLGSWTMM